MSDADPALAHLTEDFWLFDAETDHPAVVLMRYDDLDLEVVPTQVSGYAALAESIPVEYRAAADMRSQC